ncbi:hypothetical protein SNE40_023008 [Patella caerulea]
MDNASRVAVNQKENGINEAFLNDVNGTKYWEQHIADAINLYYIPVCASIGILGNSLAFLVLIRSTLRKSTTCLYMAVIAFLDTCILILNICFFVRKFPEHEIFNAWSCGFIMFLFYFVIHWDVLLVLAMTFERYLVVTFPLRASRLVTTKKTAMTIVGLGFFSLSINLHNIFTRSMVEVEADIYTCSIQGDLNKYFVTKIYSWIDSTIYCFIPLVSLFSLNILIIRNLRRSKAIKSQMTHVPPKNQRQQKGTEKSPLSTKAKTQKQVTLMLILVSFAFLFLAAPVALLTLVETYLWISTSVEEQVVHNLVHAVVDNLMYTNHAINFILYMLSGNKFRKEFKRFLCSRGQNEQTNNNRAVHVAVLAATKWSSLSKLNKDRRSSFTCSLPSTDLSTGFEDISTDIQRTINPSD